MLLLLAGCPWIPAPTGGDCAEVGYVDADGDGYGSGSPVGTLCADDEGWSALDGDCDDADAAIHPDADEVCDDLDNDCDDAIDEDPIEGEPWYFDRDSDTYGDDATAKLFCEGDGPGDRIAVGGDCNDNAPTVNPGAQEVCDDADVDEDCSGAADDADPSATGQTPWYMDADEDGHGDEGDAAPAYRCDGEPGIAATDDDCNDTDAAIHPGADETDCTDPVDYNCDGSVGYADADGDGYAACAECDDARADVNPAATEHCDDVDEDCDTDVDEDAVDPATWYCDADNDGYGDPACTTAACDLPPGYAANDQDCDDGEIGTWPGAAETPADGIDQDCDGGDTCYADLDGDGYTDRSTVASEDLDCEDTWEADASTATGECNDADAAIHPGATELCNGLDDDCDAVVDPADAADALTWYADADGDGYGDSGDTTRACEQPDGYVPGDDDCDDGDATVNPDAVEDCGTAFDDDCDGSTNLVDVTGCTSFYADADADGFGDAETSACMCEPTTAFPADEGDDCDDADDAIHPGAVESCTTAADDDCDGSTNAAGASGCTEFYADADADGYGDASASSCLCAADAEYPATDATDCDDTSGAIHPGADETCNDLDDDCDLDIDEDVAEATTWYADSDADGYGDASVTTAACEAPEGYVATGDDCDDADSAVHSCSVSADDAYVVRTGESGDYAGYAVAVLDDYDGDGSGELVAGTYGYPGAGGVYVHSSINPECTSLFYCVESWVYDSASGTGFGSALAVVPDSDGDGMPELFVGAEFASGNGGAVYGYEASYTMGRFVPTSSAFTTATFENSGDHLGASIASLGTFTDDSLPDLAFGAWGNDAAGNEAGVVYTMAVHNESADTIFLKMGSAIRGSAAGDFFGYRVCAAGDTDGDGSPDLLAGAPLADNGGLDAGAAYLLLGGALSSVGGWPSVYALADVAERTWNGLEAGDNLYTCAPGGDNDADGYADILLGAQNAGTGDGQGAAYLVLGSSSTALISEDLVDAHASWSGAESGDAFSNRLAMDGDFDADGLSDIVITAPNADDPATEAGAAWVFLGAQSGAVELADASLEILGVTAYEQLGIGLATGDLDGSGADDLVLGAPYRGGDDGAIYIFLDPP